VGLPGSYAPTDNATSGRPSNQYLFVAEDLARVNRTRTPWIIVMFHSPWYNSNSDHYEEALKHQWDMEELFYEHGVNLVINGHVHAYERSNPVYKYSVNPTHVVLCTLSLGMGATMRGPRRFGRNRNQLGAHSGKAHMVVVHLPCTTARMLTGSGAGSHA